VLPDSPSPVPSFQVNQQVGASPHIGANGGAGQLDAGLERATREARERLSGRIGMNGGKGALIVTAGMRGRINAGGRVILADPGNAPRSIEA